MKLNNFIIAAALLLASGCASFNSGDVLVPRNDLRRMLADKNFKPASDIQVVWRNFPYKNATDTIGEGVINPPKPRPVPVPIGDLAWLKDHARDIFSEAGLYDAETGSGTIKITITSYGRWTYGEIFKSFLVDTGYIFLIPASLQVNHQLIVEYNGLSGRAKVEEIGRTKTTFHVILFPLYPLFRPGAKEHSLLKNMLWRSATDVYVKTKHAGDAQPAPVEAAPRQVQQPAGTRPPAAPGAPPAATPKTQPPAPEETPDD